MSREASRGRPYPGLPSPGAPAVLIVQVFQQATPVSSLQLRQKARYLSCSHYLQTLLRGFFSRAAPAEAMEVGINSFLAVQRLNQGSRLQRQLRPAGRAPGRGRHLGPGHGSLQILCVTLGNLTFSGPWKSFPPLPANREAMETSKKLFMLLAPGVTVHNPIFYYHG